MRLVLLVSFLFVCACVTPRAAEPCPDVLPTPPALQEPKPAKPAPPPTLDEAAIKEKSHAFFEALDRADIAAFEAATGAAFVQFGAARSYARKFVIDGLQARLDRKAPVRTRRWTDERVAATPGVAIFMGEALEQVPAEGDMPAYEMDRWHTLAWVYEGGAWKAEHYQWQKGGLEAERDVWNDVFRTSAQFNRKPNQLLVDSVRGRKPGTALDLAMGQGRNGVYLATQGWKVTGVDISDEGLKKASEAAAAQKVKIETVQADADTWDLGVNKWDLVTMIYAGDDLKMVERIKPSVKKGGLVVIEYFHADATKGTGIGGFQAGTLAAAFKDGWKIVRDDVTEDIADWGLRKSKLVRFVAQKN